MALSSHQCKRENVILFITAPVGAFNFGVKDRRMCSTYSARNTLRFEIEMLTREKSSAHRKARITLSHQGRREANRLVNKIKRRLEAHRKDCWSNLLEEIGDDDDINPI